MKTTPTPGEQLVRELREQADWYTVEDPDNTDPPEWTPDESNEVADLLRRAADAIAKAEGHAS